MDVLAVFDLRTADQKDRLLELLDDEIIEKIGPLIEKAFEEGDDIWRKQTLQRVLGADGARHFLDRVDHLPPSRPAVDANASLAATGTAGAFKAELS